MAVDEQLTLIHLDLISRIGVETADTYDEIIGPNLIGKTAEPTSYRERAAKISINGPEEWIRRRMKS